MMFFHEDAFLQAGQLLCKNYCFTSDENPNEVVCDFTLANDSIKKIPGSRKKRVKEPSLVKSTMLHILP
ncbi:MAG: hypothetical protein KBT06_10315 [Prevotellaceae bacterium]|nr:hypothetical protein [Candidatus Colivivens equi]